MYLYIYIYICLYLCISLSTLVLASQNILFVKPKKWLFLLLNADLASWKVDASPLKWRPVVSSKPFLNPHLSSWSVEHILVNVFRTPSSPPHSHTYRMTCFHSMKAHGYFSLPGTMCHSWIETVEISPSTSFIAPYVCPCLMAQYFSEWVLNVVLRHAIKSLNFAVDDVVSFFPPSFSRAASNYTLLHGDHMPSPTPSVFFSNMFSDFTSLHGRAANTQDSFTVGQRFANPCEMLN